MVTRTPPIDGEDVLLEEQHLRRDHGLTKVEAWVTRPDTASPHMTAKSSSASRMAKLRARKRSAGLVSIDVPVAVASEIRDQGGLNAWQAAVAAAAVREERERAAAIWGLAPADADALFEKPQRWRCLLLRWLFGSRARWRARFAYVPSLGRVRDTGGR